MSVLESWQAAVDGFAGNGKPGKLTLWQELMRSQLSGRHVVRTSAIGTPIPLQTVALAEMRLSMPMAIDVTVSVPNIQDVDIASGGVFVTWGSTKGVANRAEIDIGRGWRHPFYASFLRVEYVSERGTTLPNGQGADLVVTASISPATGAPSLPLTCTRFFALTLPNGAVDTATIPAFAKEVRLSGSPGGNYPNIFPELLFSMSNPSGVSVFRQMLDGASVGGINSWIMNQRTWPVPQRSSGYRVQNFSANAIGNLTAIAELNL